MSSKKRNLLYCLCLISITFSSVSMAQGPDVSWYYNADIDIPWASCHIYFDGGSRQEIPFMPLICFKGAPCGTDRYTRDIDFKGPIVFVGNGIVRGDKYDCYKGLNVEGKAVLMCYDFPDSLNSALEESVTKEERITEAYKRKAAAVVLFSYDDPTPFGLFLDKNIDNVPEIPVITINREGASKILLSSGYDPENTFETWRREGSFQSVNLISKMSIKVKAIFDKIEAHNFDFRYRKAFIPQDEMEQLADVNEKSVDFIIELFKADKPVWKKSLVVYYRDYDTKIFFLHHWGRGLSAEPGTFLVYDGVKIDFPLAVHENTHTLIHDNWGGSTSFMNEGLGKYAEAKASDPERNHIAVTGFLRNGKMLHIREMLDMKIGSHEKTGIAYPASGSFVDYLISEYSLKKFRKAFEQERQRLEGKNVGDTWHTAFGKPLDELEKEWVLMIAKRHETEEEKVKGFLTQ